MAIGTFAQLQTAMADWSNRNDLTSYLPDMITLAEGRLNDMLLLKNSESEEALTLTANVNYVALPAGFISPIALWLIIDTQRLPLQMVLPQDLPYYTDSSIPKYWAIDGLNIRFDVPSDSAYAVKFRMVKASNLSASTTTNYLLSRRPDVYLAACLVEVARFTKDVDLFNEWEPKFLKAAAELKAAENRSRAVNLRTDIPASARSNILRGD